MHDGSLATLEDVVEFYSEGGRPNPNLDSDIRILELSCEEKVQLVAFLRTLSGSIGEGRMGDGKGRGFQRTRVVQFHAAFTNSRPRQLRLDRNGGRDAAEDLSQLVLSGRASSVSGKCSIFKQMAAERVGCWNETRPGIRYRM